MPIAFIDLATQRKRLGKTLDEDMLAVLDSGAFIMGPPVRAFEAALAKFGEAKHALSCANGTDALYLPLMAWNIGAGDAVFCPSFTFASTAEIIAWAGATPVFVDIDPVTYNLDPAALSAAIEEVKAAGALTPRAVIAVDLFGQPVDYPTIAALCQTHGLKLISDSAQGFGCSLNGRQPLEWADVTTTSFYPAKPLGCYGDGGAVLTNDADLAELMDSYRVHGKAVGEDLKGRTFEHDPKYLNMRVGLNSRLDTLQAVVLNHKLTIFADEIEARMRVASRYNDLLRGHVLRVPELMEGAVSTWAQYTIEHRDRDGLAAHLRAAGVPTAVYYPIPLHRQPAFPSAVTATGALPVTDAASRTVISLPMHPYLDEATQDAIVQAVKAFNG
jgi:dTDP-4-amino-4,6-dideoxygalactose transaminase